MHCANLILTILITTLKDKNLHKPVWSSISDAKGKSAEISDNFFTQY